MMQSRNRLLRGALIAVAAFAANASSAGCPVFDRSEGRPPLTSDDGEKSVNIGGVAACRPPVAGAHAWSSTTRAGWRRPRSWRTSNSKAAAKFASSETMSRQYRRFRTEEAALLGGRPQVKDLDGEAVAFDGRDFYVAGSARLFASQQQIQAVVVRAGKNPAGARHQSVDRRQRPRR